MRSHRLVQVVLQILLTLLFGLQNRISGQTASTGSLLGQVLDPAGKGIPQASVSVKNDNVGITRSTLSDDDGRFVLPLLPPGPYQLTVAKTDYSQAESMSVQVRLTETTRVSIPMKLVGITQNITVQGDASALQGDTVALGRVIEAA